jgi:uncharacterized 2Fe-2S/4Fe-4S cluster protein (DUF4445 family)
MARVFILEITSKVNGWRRGGTVRFTIDVLPEGPSLRSKPGSLLADVLTEAGIELGLYCGRRGLCGKCFVEIVRGDVPVPADEERALLARKGFPDNFRLACLLRVAANLAIRIPEESRLARMPILSSGVGRSLVLDQAVRKIQFSLSKPDMASPLSVADLVKLRFPDVPPRLSQAALRRLASFDEASSESLSGVLYEEKEFLDFEPGDTTEQCYGLAVDLGTTTIVVELVDLVSGRIVGTAAGLNAQSRFGADVLSRIAASQHEPEDLEGLRKSAVDSVNALVGDLSRRHKVAAELIYEAVLAGNTAMNHLFLGLSVRTLAVAPYHAVFSALRPLPAAEAGLRIHPRGRLYIAPNIKSFIGGDISAGLSAIDLESRSGHFLFVDLGTNGELVLKKGKRFAGTSTAAGPAFEGMAISCGMLALPGAIHQAGVSGGRLTFKTISGLPARGVCGTGLIDLVSAFLKTGALTPGGRILVPARELAITKKLSLTQKDVRELQLAAAAVKTGIHMLLDSCGLVPHDLAGIFVAGAFGSYLNISNAVRLGILPRLPRGKIFFIGNSSLAGARALLLSRRERRRCEQLAAGVRHLNLAQNEEFQKIFIQSLKFEPWD